ncbi:jg13761, partial [Pararge aegeria aegeria]
MDQITFIGFSLGASLMGFSGNEYERETGTKYSRIIGCDPAGPFFDGIISLPSLDALDADFVMSMHTNPKRLGTDEKKSTMDVSANCGNPVQPGCETAGGGLGIRTPE